MDIVVAKDILKANDQLARVNRKRLDDAGVLGVNIMSSPGAGKTALLERLASALKGSLRFAVIEGDLATARDAERLEKVGINTVQINTGGGCHLDANMVQSALDSIALKELDVLFIENVGNLVCPSSYQLGEHRRLVLLSAPEGDDKVAKYPPMFRAIDALAITKTDLLPHLEFDCARVEQEFHALSPDSPVFKISARTGEGVPALVDWLKKLRSQQAGGQA